jgi:anti-anti-sigma factor
MAILGRQRLPGTKVPSPRQGETGLRTLVISLPTHVDESNAAQVRATLTAAAERRPRVLIADMSGTRWCDWAGAGALASTFCRAATAGTELRLVLTDDSVRRVMSVNGLDQLLPIFGDVTAAAATPHGG